MAWFGWPWFFLWFSDPSVFYPNLLEPFQVHQLQSVSPSPSYSTVFLVFCQDSSICSSFRSLLFLVFGSPEWKHPVDGEFFFFLLINTWSGLLVGIKWSVCTSKFDIIFVSFSWTDSGLCVCHLVIWLKIQSLSNSKRMTFATMSWLSCTPSVLVCCIRLLCH